MEKFNESGKEAERNLMNEAIVETQEKFPDLKANDSIPFLTEIDGWLKDGYDFKDAVNKSLNRFGIVGEDQSPFRSLAGLYNGKKPKRAGVDINKYEQERLYKEGILDDAAQHEANMDPENIGRSQYHIQD